VYSLEHSGHGGSVSVTGKVYSSPGTAEEAAELRAARSTRPPGSGSGPADFVSQDGALVPQLRQLGVLGRVPAQQHRRD
jgi:hypothetical protein